MKVGEDGRFLCRQSELFPAQLEALHHEGHVPSQGAHGLQALGAAAVDHVPVLAGGHGHASWMKSARASTPASAEASWLSLGAMPPRSGRSGRIEPRRIETAQQKGARDSSSPAQLRRSSMVSAKMPPMTSM